MSAGGTGPRHQPGCGFMQEQLGGSDGGSEKEQERGEQVRMSHTGCSTFSAAGVCVCVCVVTPPCNLHRDL